MADIRTFGAVPDGTTDCTTAIQTAINAGDIEINNGVFLYSGGVTIPSNRTVTGKNAILKLADNSHNNFFRNSDFVNGNSNITIKGIGNFCFDGNSVNNDDDYVTYGPVGSATIYRYQGIAFYKVDTFEISGINIVDYSHWFFLPQHCTNGVIGNLHFNYYTVTKNQDGIDVAHGCNNIAISGIKGSVGDDMLVLWASGKGDAGVRESGWNVGDIHDISIDLITLYHSPYHTFITLGGDGNKIYNITGEDWIVFSCLFFCYFGLTGYYTVAPAKGDVKTMTFDNINVKVSADTCIKVLEDCEDITFTNWDNDSGRSDYSEGAGLDVVNFTINGVDQSV
jgi:hypothetical protein